MSRIIRDWRCPYCGLVHERMTRRDVERSPCPFCGKGACRPMPSAPKLATLKMGADPDFPTASEKWAKAHNNVAQSDD